MRLRRRHPLFFWSLVGCAGLAGAGAWLALRGGVERYTPGAETEGITAGLRRGLPADAPELLFVDVARESGLVFRHFPAGPRSGRLPEDMGSGVALGDVDLDGWTDAFLVNAGGALAGQTQGWGEVDARSRLFRNAGAGRFEDATEASGIVHETLGMAAAFLDDDSDGDLDLLVTSYPALDHFTNETVAPAAPRFRATTTEAGLDGPRGFWTGIASGDPDRDGDIDAYVCGYVRYTEEKASRGQASQYGREIPALLNPSVFEPERNLYWENDGAGRFTERAGELGVANEAGRSLSATFADLTGDGWPDLYVANDVSDNAFFKNLGGGNFRDETAQALLGDYRGAMGMAIADFDGDLDLDLHITHWIAQENALFVAELTTRAEGERTAVFFDQADRHGLGQTTLGVIGWATRFLDVDGDGRLDLFAINGSTLPVRGAPAELEPMRSQLFWHGSSRDGFYELGAASGGFFAEPHVGRGGATFDADLDGDEDLVVVLHGEEARFLRNERGQEKRWLRVRLREPSGNTFALGARVQATAGGARRIDEVGTDGSYLSQHALGEVAFGLGDLPAVQELEVAWPDGTRERAGPFPADALVTWVRGSAPRVEPLPGKRHVEDEPPPPDVQRRFYATRERGTAARLAGEHAQAIDEYRAALLLWPAHADCLYYLANSLVALGREGEALAALRELVAFHPMQSAAWVQLGRIHLPGGDPALDDLDAAEDAFRHAHDLNREESGPVVRLGEVALLRGELAAAERWLDDAVAMNPRSVEGLYLAGKAAWLAGQPARAEELLQRARKLAAETPAGKSTLDEGNTKTGTALTERSQDWRSLAARETDAAREYAGH